MCNLHHCTIHIIFFNSGFRPQRTDCPAIISPPLPGSIEAIPKSHHGLNIRKTRKAVVLDSLFVKNVINFLVLSTKKNYFATVNFRVIGIDSISLSAIFDLAKMPD